MMKKGLLILMVIFAGVGFIRPTAASAYNFGDFKSETLVSKAWSALKAEDLEGVLAYTNKCLELYAEEAQKMQATLDDYPEGENEEIFAYWALNDVATALFIQGEAYRRADMEEEALAVFKKLVEEYTYGQAWDTNGWFWKPAEAAKEKMAMIDSGSTLDFGDYSSSFLTTQAWKTLEDVQDADSAVFAYTNKVLNLYEDKAQEMQASLDEYPWQSRKVIFNYWALNDVGTSLYIQGEAYKRIGETQRAKEAYQKLIDDYYYAQAWDPQGWFWKPAEAAQEALDDLGEI
jgi:tetratricopeptide (TPR) repeat protein